MTKNRTLYRDIRVLLTGVIVLSLISAVTYWLHQATRLTRNNSLMYVSWQITGTGWGKINGMLEDSAGRPVADASVMVWTVDGSLERGSDAAGHFTFDGIGGYGEITEIEVRSGGNSKKLDTSWFPIDAHQGVDLKIRLKGITHPVGGR